MAKWPILPLIKYLTGHARPHKRTGFQGFFPNQGHVFTGIARKRDLGFGQVSEWERGRPK